MVQDQTSINHRKGIGLFVLVSLLVLYLPTRATNFISTWILSTFCCPLKEIADTLWHELASDWVILPHPWDFMFKGAPDFSLCTSFPFAPLPPVGFFSPSSAVVTHLSARRRPPPLLSDGQVLAASDGVICHKCAKTWLIGEMSSEVVENSTAPRIEKRAPISIHLKYWQMVPVLIFHLFYTASLSSFMFYIIRRLIYSPLEVSAYCHLRKTTESVGPILTEQLEMQLDVNNECTLDLFSALNSESFVKDTYMWNRQLTVNGYSAKSPDIFGIVHFCKPQTQYQHFYNTCYITSRLHVCEPAVMSKGGWRHLSSSRPLFEIDFQHRKHETRWFWEDVRTFSSRLYGEKTRWAIKWYFI